MKLNENHLRNIDWLIRESIEDNFDTEKLQIRNLNIIIFSKT